MAERQAHPPERGGARPGGRRVRLARPTPRSLPPPANDNRLARGGLALVAALLVALAALALFLAGAAG